MFGTILLPCLAVIYCLTLNPPAGVDLQSVPPASANLNMCFVLQKQKFGITRFVCDLSVYTSLQTLFLFSAIVAEVWITNLHQRVVY